MDFPGDLIHNPPAIIKTAGIGERSTNKNGRLLELFNKLLKSQKHKADSEESISRQLATLLNVANVQLLGEGDGSLDGIYKSAINSLNKENLAKFTKLAFEEIAKENILLKEFKDKKQLNKEDLFRIVKILASNDKVDLGASLLNLAIKQSGNDRGVRGPRGSRGPIGPSGGAQSEGGIGSSASSNSRKPNRWKARVGAKQYVENSPWEKEFIYKMNSVDGSISTKAYKSIHKSVEAYIQREEGRNKTTIPLPLRSQFKKIIRSFGESPAGALDLLKLLPEKNREAILIKLNDKYFNIDEINKSTPFADPKDLMPKLVSEAYQNYDAMLSRMIDKDPFLQRHPKLKQELKDKAMQLIISSGSKEELLFRIAELYLGVEAPSQEKTESVVLIASSFSLLMEPVKEFIAKFYY